jgi:hypothetical protein
MRPKDVNRASTRDGAEGRHSPCSCGSQDRGILFVYCKKSAIGINPRYAYMGGANDGFWSVRRHCWGRLEYSGVFCLLVAPAAPSGNISCSGQPRPGHTDAPGAVSPAAEACRNPTPGSIATGAVAVRALDMERSPVCMDPGAVYRAPRAERQLGPRLLAAGPRGLDLGRRPLGLVNPSRRRALFLISAAWPGRSTLMASWSAIPKTEFFGGVLRRRISTKRIRTGLSSRRRNRARRPP